MKSIQAEAPDQAPNESTPHANKTSSKNFVGSRILLIFLTFILAAGVGLNYLLVYRPVSEAVGKDERNSGYSLWAYYRYFVDPSTVVLDLREVEHASPTDLFRAIFQSAEAHHTAGRKFDHVVLARTGEPVFVLKGEEYTQLGSEYNAGQNPVYLIRTLPEKLYKPDGTAAFSRWEGGWLGVLGRQMRDANDAARQWGGFK